MSSNVNQREADVATIQHSTAQEAHKQMATNYFYTQRATFAILTNSTVFGTNTKKNYEITLYDNKFYDVTIL